MYMYLQNKYSKWYYNIVNRAKSISNASGYTEKHHIIPKSLGGDDSIDNIVILTAREHFICHLLLPKMLTGVNKRNMSFAIWSMVNRDHSNNKERYKVNSHHYQLLKKQVSRALSELHTGKTVSAEARKNIGDASRGRKSAMKGKHFPESFGRNVSIAAKNRIPITCEHCNKTVSPCNHSRWHGDNCKLLHLSSSS